MNQLGGEGGGGTEIFIYLFILFYFKTIKLKKITAAQPRHKLT
jgi:hypothetical protein